ncbi:Halomucin [Termitomyces sp. J132]|nr:Halomucin [Termitomyces sp. J132]
MRLLSFVSKQSRQTSKAGFFGMNPDVISGAAAVLATFAYQAILYRPSACIPSPTTQKTLPAIPATRTSTLPPSKTIPPLSIVENDPSVVLIGCGIILILSLVGSVAVVTTRTNPGNKRSNSLGDGDDTCKDANHSASKTTGSHDDDPDSNSPPGDEKDNTGSKDNSDGTGDKDDDKGDDSPNDNDDEDVNEVEDLLNDDDSGDDEDIDEVESFLNQDDDDDDDDEDMGEIESFLHEDGGDDPPDDPPPPSSGIDTPDDILPSRVSRLHPFFNWFFDFCHVFAKSVACHLTESLCRRVLVGLLNGLHKVKKSFNRTPQVLVRRMITETPKSLGSSSCSHSPRVLPPETGLETSGINTNSLIKVLAFMVINGWSVAITLRYRLRWNKTEEVPATTDEIVLVDDSEDEGQNLTVDTSQLAHEAVVCPAAIPLPEDHENDFNPALYVPVPNVDEREFDLPLCVPLPDNHDDFNPALWVPLPNVDEREFDLSLCIPLPQDHDDFDLALWVSLPEVDEHELDPSLCIHIPEDHENNFDKALWTPLPDIAEREFDLPLCIPLPDDHENDFDMALWTPLPDVDEREFDPSLWIPLPEDHENDFEMALWTPLPEVEDHEFDLSLGVPLPEDGENDFNMALWVPLPAIDESEFDLSLHVPLPEDDEDDFNMALCVPLPDVKSCEFDLSLLTALPEDDEHDFDMAYWTPLPSDDGDAFDLPTTVECAPVVAKFSASMTNDVFNVPTPVEPTPGVALATTPRQRNMGMAPYAPVFEPRTHIPQPSHQSSPLFTPRPLQRPRQPIPISTPFTPHASTSSQRHMEPVQQPHGVMVFLSPSAGLQRSTMRLPAVPAPPASPIPSMGGHQPLHFSPYTNFNPNIPTRQHHNPNAGAVTPCPPRQQRPGRMTQMSRPRPAVRSESPPRPIAIIRPSPSFEERHRIETEREAQRIREEREAAKIERQRVRDEGWKRIQEERKARQEAREAAERSRREARRERQVKQQSVPPGEDDTRIAGVSTAVNDSTSPVRASPLRGPVLLRDQGQQQAHGSKDTLCLPLQTEKKSD